MAQAALGQVIMDSRYRSVRILGVKPS